jgi:osmotically-inducible protein OsmY
VHLLGSVPTGRDRGLVERVARGVRGVKAVSNDLDTIDDRDEPAGGADVAET